MKKTVFLMVKLLVDYDTQLDDIVYDLEDVCESTLPDYVSQVDVYIPEEQLPE